MRVLARSNNGSRSFLEYPNDGLLGACSFCAIGSDIRKRGMFSGAKKISVEYLRTRALSQR